MLTVSSDLVSVIVPFYSHPEFLSQALESVLGQTHQHIEVIVVDDGSPHDLTSIIQPYLNDTRLSTIHQENRGVASARNAGIRAAHGAYFQFLDSDDWLAPDKITRHVRALEENPDVGMVFCPTVLVDGSNVIGALDMLRDRRWLAEGNFFTSFWATNRAVVHAPLVRKEWITAAGDFDESELTEDYEFWLRLAALDCPILSLPDALVYTRLDSQERSRDNNARTRKIATRERIIRRFPGLAAQATERSFEIWDDIWNEQQAWISTLQDNLAGKAESHGQLTRDYDELRQWAAHQQETITTQAAEIARLTATWDELHGWADQQAAEIARLTAAWDELHGWADQQAAEIARLNAAWDELHQWADHQQETITTQAAEIARLNTRRRWRA